MSTPQNPPATNREAGLVEECREGFVSGWAQVPGISLMPAILDVAVDGFPAGSVKANVFRPDLRKLGIRDGFAAFRFSVPDRYHDGKTHHVTVTERVSKAVLGGIGLFRFEAVAEKPTRDRMFLYSVVQSHTLDTPAFASAVAAKRKLAILAVYAPGNRLLGFHHQLIAMLAEMGFAVVLGLGRAEDPSMTVAPPLDSKADAYLIKDNLGYDFGTWFAALAAAKPHLPQVEELLFINDSIFGPLCPARALSDMISSAQSDVVGICDSYERAYHLQSFFLLFRRKALESGFLFDFADTYPFSNVKEDVIRDGEISLTQSLLSAGLSCEALFPYERLARRWLDRAAEYLSAARLLPEYVSDSDASVQHLLAWVRLLRRGEPLNPSHFFWDTLIERGCPFVKRELLIKNPMETPLIARAPALIEASGYSLAYVREAAQRYGTSKVFF
jgi:hypothetical protein